MMKRIKYLLLLLLLTPFVVFADSKCNYTIQAEHRKIANNISASYDIVENSVVAYKVDAYIDITILNVSEGIYINYTATSLENKTKSIKQTIHSSDATDGTFHIKHDDIENVYKYTFEIYSSTSGCSKIRTFSLTIPKYNKYSILDDCQYEFLNDYVWCQRWITNTSSLNEAQIKEKIKKYRENFQKTTTTSKVITDNSEEDNYERLVKLREYAIIGLSVGIIVDFISIIVMYVRLKDFLKYDI